MKEKMLTCDSCERVLIIKESKKTFIYNEHILKCNFCGSKLKLTKQKDGYIYSRKIAGDVLSRYNNKK